MSAKLADILANPLRAADVSIENIPPLLAQLAAVQSALAARLLTTQDNRKANSEDQLLEIDEAAGKMGVTKDWLYRRTDKLPFVVRLGRNVRFSQCGIEKFIRQRVGK